MSKFFAFVVWKILNFRTEFNFCGVRYCLLLLLGCFTDCKLNIRSKSHSWAFLFPFFSWFKPVFKLVSLKKCCSERRWLIEGAHTCCTHRPKVLLVLHWHFPWVQKCPHMQRIPVQHWAYAIFASGRQKSPHFPHHLFLLSWYENDTMSSSGFGLLGTMFLVFSSKGGFKSVSQNYFLRKNSPLQIVEDVQLILITV